MLSGAALPTMLSAAAMPAGHGPTNQPVNQMALVQFMRPAAAGLPAAAPHTWNTLQEAALPTASAAGLQQQREQHLQGPAGHSSSVPTNMAQLQFSPLSAPAAAGSAADTEQAAARLAATAAAGTAAAAVHGPEVPGSATLWNDAAAGQQPLGVSGQAFQQAWLRHANPPAPQQEQAPWHAPQQVAQQQSPASHVAGGTPMQHAAASHFFFQQQSRLQARTCMAAPASSPLPCHRLQQQWLHLQVLLVVHNRQVLGLVQLLQCISKNSLQHHSSSSSRAKG